MTYPAALPHDLPKAIAEDLFVVYGSVKLMPGVGLTRNMAIVRDGDDLTLINPVRMNEAGLASLETLGTVRHVLRLGPLHGMDESFYLDRYKPQFWAFTDGSTYPVPAEVIPLVDGGALPFSDARLLAFDHLSETEGVILLRRDKANVLLTCDAVQSYSTPPHMPHTAGWAQKLFSLIGFTRDTIIGPIWIKKMALDRKGLREEFVRILKMDFDQLLSSHGTFVEGGAHQELQRAFDKVFPESH